MRPVCAPVVEVHASKFEAVNDEEILRVAFLCSLAEVGRTSDDNRAVDDHHLVVCDGVGGIDESGNAGPD